MLLLIERCSEKYVKKLIGRAGTEIEDALKRLDNLTREEAWMGIAQTLKAMHDVGEGVRGVADNVVAIDNRVAGVDDRVAGVSDRVASVDNTVKGVNDIVANVDDRVRVVDDRVVEVIRGT
jgi:methyl-accepting chemotaxis protein